MNLALPPRNRATERGSIFILVLWISFGMIVLALYFAHSMGFELRAADNRVAAVESEHAVNGAARYVSYILSNYATNGAVPDLSFYSAEDVPVGESTFWLIGRDATSLLSSDVPKFALVDEASKLNLNATNLTADMLATLPGMTVELAAAIIDWRDSDSTATASGAEDDVYQRLTPARKCKNANFESVDELRLVYGATLDILFGEDLNRNGILDSNENDGDVSLPVDNRDGRLNPGLLEYVTVYSRQPNTTITGTNRLNVSNRQQLTTLLTQKFGQQRANAIVGQLGGANTQFRSLLEFYARSGMSADEFAQIEGEVSASNASFIDGLVNVNTASEAVLACIPGIGLDKAPSLIAYRQSNSGQLNSMGWLKEVLSQEQMVQAGPYVTGQSYQFSADVAALGHHGRGFQRTRFVFDTSEGTPKILFRQDLTSLGWALGAKVRDDLRLAKNLRK